MRKRTRIAVIALVAMLGFGAAGLAWAAFTKTSTATAVGGSGGQLVDLQTLNTAYVYQDSAPDLYPNKSATVKLHVKNPNDVAITVTGIAGSGKNVTTVVAADAPYCAGLLNQNAIATFDVHNTSDVLTNDDVTSYTIPAGAEVVLVLTNGLTFGDADNRCQNMDFSTIWSISIANA